MKIPITIPEGPLHNGPVKQYRPVAAVLLFFAMVPVVFFYNSKKVILWESKDRDAPVSIFKQAALSYAGAAESIKGKLKLEEPFQKELAFWRSAKDSPLVFGQPEASLSLYGVDGSVPEDVIAATGTDALQDIGLPGIDPAGTTTSPETAAATTSGDNDILLRRADDLGRPASAAVSNKLSAPFRIMIVGDSFVAAGGGLGDPLERVLLSNKDTAVARQGKVSSGLSRRDYFDWQAVAQKMIRQHKPNVVVMMFGANDNISIIDPDGRLLAGWGSAKWDDRYRERIGAMIGMFTQAKAEIFVIGVPIMKNKTLSQTMSHINSLYEEEVRKYPNAHYIPTWDLLSDREGNYTDYLLDKDGKKRLIRTSDGVHLQYFAGYYVTDAIIARMRDFIDLRSK